MHSGANKIMVLVPAQITLRYEMRTDFNTE